MKTKYTVAIAMVVSFALDMAVSVDYAAAKITVTFG